MRKALVVLSGGQDSATCMAWAAMNFDGIEALSFNYKQRHSRELESAKRIAAMFAAPHRVVDVPALMDNPTSGLTSASLKVGETDEKTGLPKSFVPGRNLIFLTNAASIALSLGMADIVTGVCQTDYSGYPDCRRATVDALQHAIALGNINMLPGKDPEQFQIHTPLMYMTKAETVKLAWRLPNGWQAVAESWTCYEGGEKPCGVCPACDLRAKGFAEAGMDDPALKR